MENESKESQNIDTEVEMTEEEMVEAAKRAGEAAAESDFKSDAEALRKERDELQSRLDEVANEIEAAKTEAATATDRLARLQADWDNYRKRTAQERLAERERAAEKLVVDLLPVLDDMERALDHARSQSEGNEQLSQFIEGIVAIHDKMFSTLEKEGVEVIDPKGEAFNPEEHQAVGRVEDADAYDESVCDVWQKGYRMGGKLIRNAMVTVSFGGPKRPVEEVEVSEEDAEETEE